MARHIVERLTESLVMASMFAADPGLYFGSKDCPLLALSTYRLTEERLTEKVRAA
jgi:hypothetical protein